MVNYYVFYPLSPVHVPGWKEASFLWGEGGGRPNRRKKIHPESALVYKSKKDRGPASLINGNTEEM